MKISFWGSSLVSAYWNGAATYYRGILRTLAGLGHEIVFYEPDAYDRQKHRDIPDPDWARIVVYDPANTCEVDCLIRDSERSEVVVKASGVGVLDTLLEDRISALPAHVCKVFWDVDAPATLDRLLADASDPFHDPLQRFDLVLTYGGGQPVVSRYESLGARRCVPVYNAFDPDTHHPVQADARFTCDLSFLGNRLPDREARVEEFFLRAAELAPQGRFLLGGNGWADKRLPNNVTYVGHVYTRDHNAFNCSSRMVLNISRESMARYGFSPATRVFEAAGSATCLITDMWEGLELFLTPGREALVARDGADVARLVREIDANAARNIGLAARSRVLREHTYDRRGKLVDLFLTETVASLVPSCGVTAEELQV
jgi:spore maturation protein CgeB